MIPPGSRVLCAVSGGADSICLLYQLSRLRPVLDFQLYAAHYNHHLRGTESDRDQAFVDGFVRACCGPIRSRRPDGSLFESGAVALVVGGGDVRAQAAREGTGIEETARNMRYRFLYDTARRLGCDRIATAHTADDNLETLLLHLLRGTGLRGLTGIPPKRGAVIRPMLTTTRAQVEDFLRRQGLPHIEDSSNNDDTYARNRLRHQVLPVLDAIQPGVSARLSSTIELLRMDEDYLSDQARAVSSQARACEGGLEIEAAAVAALPDALATRAVRQLLGAMAQDNDDCTAAHLFGILGLCRGDSPSARLDLPHGIVARRVYDRLELTQRRESPPLEELPLPLPGKVRWGGFQITIEREHYAGAGHAPGVLWLSCTRVAGALTLRRRKVGDTLTRPGRPAKTLKKWMIEEKVPRHLRPLVPVFDCGGRVAAVAGLGTDTAFLPRQGEEAWKVTCRPLSPHQKTEKGSF